MAKKKIDKPPPVAIAILDSHWLIREAIASWLQECAGFQVAWKGATRAELEQAMDAGLRVDLVVVAVASGEEEGFEALKWLQEEWPALRCAAYAHRHDELTILRVYRHRAHALLLAMVEGEAVRCALNAVLAGRVFHSTLSQELLLENPDGLSQADRNLARMRAKVSRKQLEVLEGAVRYADLSETRLAHLLGMSPGTLHTHLIKLYAIFGVNSRAALVVAAIRVGMVRV